MTEPFAASNGIQITMDTDRDGKVYLVGHRARGDEGQYLDTHATGGPEGIVALREFFQHERDEELGRWRDPDNPRLTVYPTDVYETDEITILDDVYTETYTITRASAERSQGGWWHDTAKAYFEAHPERKPWEEAKPGEVWLFRGKGDIKPSAFMKSHFGWTNSEAVVVQRDPALPYGGTRDESFKPRRIWPEDAS